VCSRFPIRDNLIFFARRYGEGAKSEYPLKFVVFEGGWVSNQLGPKCYVEGDVPDQSFL